MEERGETLRFHFLVFSYSKPVAVQTTFSKAKIRLGYVKLVLARKDVSIGLLKLNF